MLAARDPIHTMFAPEWSSMCSSAARMSSLLPTKSTATDASQSGPAMAETFETKMSMPPMVSTAQSTTAVGSPFAPISAGR